MQDSKPGICGKTLGLRIKNAIRVYNLAVFQVPEGLSLALQRC